MQKKHPPLEVLLIAKHIKLVWAAKAFLKQQVKEVVNSDSDKEEEEERLLVIKKIKHKHVEGPIGVSKQKEIIELQDEMVALKTPVAGPSCQTLKPVVLISSVPKSVPKLIVALATPVAGPSTACIVLSLASKPAAAMPMSKPAPVQSAEDTGNKNNNDKGSNNNEDDDEGGKNDDNDSDNYNNAAMDIDSGNLDVEISKTLHPEETWSTVPTKVTVTEDIVPVPVPVANETK
ncbi:hypothetical protein C0995_008287 [Termitomyces sp. Mi166|nr:hypothetical protein C0995_008287 [Termitomyces sp. Mi166\